MMQERHLATDRRDLRARASVSDQREIIAGDQIDERRAAPIAAWVTG